MSYILADQRDTNVVCAFASYREYLLERRPRFPTSAYALRPTGISISRIGDARMIVGLSLSR
jgi:hypothetical protein